MVRNCNDGTRRPPYLRVDLSMGNVGQLPAFSRGPRGQGLELLETIQAAGYDGVQGADGALARQAGLKATSGARINQVGEAEEIVRKGKDGGFDCITAHVAWGLESDAEVDALVRDILQTCARHDYPIYIETHRATITQDPWRTLQLVKRFPDIRFNGDFSHWYTGCEMVYGDFEAKLETLAPVFERVRFLHGRIGNPGSMQADLGPAPGAAQGKQDYVAHFREMWKRSFTGFLKTAGPGDFICFTPELLPADIYYARLVPDGAGGWHEESDRWEQALVLTHIAR